MTDLRVINEQRPHAKFCPIDAITVRQFDLNVGFVASLQGRAQPRRVEMTHQRVAAYGHRTFNAGFLAMNAGARPSRPGRKQTIDSLHTCE